MQIESMCKISKVFQGCQFMFIKPDMYIDTSQGVPDIELLRKIEDFCLRYTQKKDFGKINYPAYYIKGKNGAYFKNMCFEPLFNRDDNDYSYYKGIYLDFNFSSVGDSHVDIYIDGEITLVITKKNSNILTMSNEELIINFNIDKSILSTICEIDDYANGDIYIDRFNDEYTIHDLNYVIINKFSEKTKKMFDVFFKSF
jgi:hypothetical protein